MQEFSFSNTIDPDKGGLFSSLGIGMHPTRIIDTWELIFVVDGVLGIREEDQAFSLGVGDALLLEPGREHAGTAPYPDDLSFYWVHFRMNIGGGSPVFSPKHAHISNMDRMVTLLRRYLDDQGSGGLDSISGSLILQLCLREMQLAGINSAHTRPVAALATQADIWLARHCREPITAGDVAEALRCHPDYLGRVYKQTFLRTITDGIHQQRVLLAKKMLLDSLMNVDEIARASGFSDAHYFRRIFKKLNGISPKSFRLMYALVNRNGA